MSDFGAILAAAEARAGGPKALQERLPTPKTDRQFRATADDRYLSLMARRIFRAGLSHRMVDSKWLAFEKVFFAFEPKRVRAIPDEALEALMGDRRIIRHWGKLKAVHANAAAMDELATQCGGFGAYLAAWPGADIVGLWADLAKRSSHMGGGSGPMFLRMAGKDTFVFSPDVVRALNKLGVIAGEPKTKAARAAVQSAFTDWAQSTGRPLCQLSMILAVFADC